MMSTSNQENKGSYCLESFEDDDLVITGISGRFPLADNMEELKQNLFSKKNCIIHADERWASGLPNLPDNFVAPIKRLDQFDAEYFNMNATTATTEDPQHRIMFEVVYEALTDSGYGTEELKGKKIGVIVGESDPDTSALVRAEDENASSKAAVGFIACMLSNRISHRFDFTGPSFSIDTACSSSGAALEDAFRRLKDGSIEAALVGGTSVTLDPKASGCYLSMGILNPNGLSCSFDARANGLVKAEAIAAVFIQRKKDARRIYAKIHNIVCLSAGHVPEGIFFTTVRAEAALMRNTFDAIGMDPSIVDYIEGHGTSTPIGDPTEVNAIAEVMCANRKTPLLLGGMKSNIGHTEAASAICSIAKIIFAFETGLIAPNINYEIPNPKCPSLTDGRIKVVTEATPYDKPLACFNNFGFGGVTVHAILERNPVKKAPEETEIKIPQLVIYSGRTENALTDLFSDFHQNPKPREFFTLLTNSAYNPHIAFPYRGYTILKKDDPPITCIAHCAPVKREVWYILTGMGCQWPGMGSDLMQLDVFAESMKKSAELLKSLGINLMEFLNPEKDHFQRDRNITPAFVTIAAIQVALIDVLKALGLEPDGIIGHSTGELACAYADGCCTAKEAVLSAYYRGASVESSNLPPGAMAAVGLTWEEATKRCPEGVFPACHNAEDSVTISGDKNAVEKFVEQLKSENIFAKVVNAYGFAFHCNHVAVAGEKLYSSLKKVYTNPQQRSKRWLSSSYVEKDWNSRKCQTIDADYFRHNLESQVRFKEALHHIPEDAITIEIGPHFLLQSIVKRSVGNKADYIGLMKRNENNVDFLLSSIGKLYNLGLNPQVMNLYPPVSYPVPRGTPMISPLLQWDHSASYFVPVYAPQAVGKKNIKVLTSSAESFLLDHFIDGRPLYPATGYIYLAWKTLSKTLNKSMESLPICVENFKILRATILNSREVKNFEVSILDMKGEFEIVEGGSVVATGKISCPMKPMFEDADCSYEPPKDSVIVPGADVYNELKIHGYEYGPAFQGLLEVNLEGTEGLVKWNNEWISFLDSMLLLFGIIYENSEFKLPTGALSFSVDPNVHKKFVDGMETKGLKGVPVKYDKYLQLCTAPGVRIERLNLEIAPRRPLTDVVPVLEEYGFVPYNDATPLGIEQTKECESYIEVCCHLAKEVVRRLNLTGEFPKLLNATILNKNVNSEEYLQKSDENYSLLNTMKTILDMSFVEKSTAKITGQLQNLSDIFISDVLFHSVLKERPLRSLTDVVVENSLGKVVVSEWCDNGPTLLSNVQETMKFYAQIKASYTLIHSRTTTIDYEDLNDKNILIECAGENDAIPDNLADSCHLGITCFISGSRESLGHCIRKVVSVVKDEGFVLVVHKHRLIPPEEFLCALSKRPYPVQSEGEIEAFFSTEKLRVVAKKSCFFGVNLYLLRKLPDKVQDGQASVVKVQEVNFGPWVEDLKKAMTAVQDRDNVDRVILVAQDSPFSGIIGMVNCLKQEPGGNKIRCVFTDSSAAPFELKNSVYADTLKGNLLMNVYQNGQWGSFRHTSLPGGNPRDHTSHAYVECLKPGDLSSLEWVQIPTKSIQSQEENDELYHVYYSALNFKDVMVATGKLGASTFTESGHKTDEFLIGLEFSGRDKNGRRITAMCGGGSVCDTFFRKVLTKCEVPDDWTLEQAATVPVVYSTCYYGLILKGNLQHGEKILIHSGTGGIGQAAIRIALSMSCEIFTTVGTQEKRDFILKTFPQIKRENIGNSRDRSFENMVMTQTKGEGVDVVLNSLADDKFQASVRCLAKHGRFLEIGKYDLQLDNSLGLRVFLKDISFHSVQLDTYFQRTPKSKMLLNKICDLIDDGIRRGVVQPLNTTVFSVEKVEEAFRYMGSGKHIGKVLLKIREEETSVKVTIPPPVKVNALKNFNLYANKSYIIIGGLGGFGIELAKWLVGKGAGTVILTSRYGARTPYYHLCLKRWKDAGARVLVSTLNVVKKEEAKKLLEETAAKFGPVGGIFNSAVVLRDGFIENQNASHFEEVCAPKAKATKNLDELTRKMCPDLDMFVCFSSISCGKGNAGQSNYGYANSVMERICELRKKDGLHGLAVQWGIIGDVGLVHRHMGDDAMIAGVMAQKIKSCLQCLEIFLLQDKPVVSSYVTADASRMKKKSNNILSQISKLFSIPDIDRMNPYRTFGEMGIDSMVGVEMKQLLESSFDVQFTLQDIQHMKLADVKKLVEEQEKGKAMLDANPKIVKPITFSGPDDIFSTEAIATLNNDRKGEPLFIMHSSGILLQKLTTLTAYLKTPVFCLQNTRDMPLNSLTEMSLWYLKQIQKAHPATSIHLASTSTATNLALEMALQSQNQESQLPNIRSFTIIDGALDLMDIHTTTELEKKKNASVHESSDLCEFLSAFTDNDLTELKTSLELLPDLESRIKMIESLLPSARKREYLEGTEFFIKKQRLIRSHLPTGKLHKDITIIEASEKVLSNDVSTVKSFMSQMCDGHVTVHRILGNYTFAEGDSSAEEVASLMNKFVS